MKKVLIILTFATAIIGGAWWHRAHYEQCPRCGAYVPRSEMHYVPERDDIDMYCPDCGYSFYLTHKRINPDSTVSATINPQVWHTDYEYYKNKKVYN